MRVSEKGVLRYLEELAVKAPDLPLLGSGGRWFDARTVLAFAEHIGTCLRRMGLGAGAAAAMHPDRTISSALMLLGLRAAGVTAVLFDPRQSHEQVLESLGTNLRITAWIEQNGKTGFTVTMPDAPSQSRAVDLYALPPADGLPMADDPTGPAFIIFTSGSTGKSKAVVLSEWNLVSNLIDSQPLGDYEFGDRAMGCLPLQHVFGLVMLCGTAVLGYGMYLQEETDADTILSAVQREKLTRMNGVPSLYLALADRCGGYDVSSLRAGFIGGGPVTDAQFAMIEKKLQMTLIPVYGMSEFIGISCADAKDSLEKRMAGVGRFYSMNTGRILKEDGSEAGPMETGEICANGPARMLGYLGEPMAADEFLHTGDLGYLDREGVLHLNGRKKDIIIRNGNNISARKIEQALLNVPGVRDAAVVAIPDERQGEVPAAMVVTDEKIEELSPALQKNEIPAVYLFTDALPLTASRKPDRQRIREVLTACRNG